MNIVLPILFAAVLVGLFVRRITRGTYWAMAMFISLVIAYNYFKTP